MREQIYILKNLKFKNIIKKLCKQPLRNTMIESSIKELSISNNISR